MKDKKTKNKNKRITIEILASFGSPFQEEFAIDTLRMVLDAWTNYVDSRHVGNSITYHPFLDGKLIYLSYPLENQ